MRILLGFMTLVLLLYGIQALGCGATLDCGETCIAQAPIGGSASCYTEGGVAYCFAYDEDNNLVSEDIATCPTGGGSGGSGGSGSPQYCSLYWWMCDPWSY